MSKFKIKPKTNQNVKNVPSPTAANSVQANPRTENQSWPPVPNPNPKDIVMPVPAITNTPIDCPPGLEYLLSIDQLLIKQRVEIFETLTGIQTNNSYFVQNSLGQNFFYIRERNDFISLQCWGSQRGFEINVWDFYQNEVIHLSRPIRCNSCLCFCCLQLLRVESPPGRLIGHVRQMCDIIRPYFHIVDDSERLLFRIRGPILLFEMCPPEKEFVVLSAVADVQVACIRKQWSGMMREIYTNADIYGVSFPTDMDVRAKALIISAAFLIDFMFFERDLSDHHRRRRRYGSHDSW